MHIYNHASGAPGEGDDCDPALCPSSELHSLQGQEGQEGQEGQDSGATCWSEGLFALPQGEEAQVGPHTG